MPRGRDVSSSDIDRARALTQRLAGGVAKRESPKADGGYIRFDPARSGAPAGAHPGTPDAPRSPAPPPPPAEGADWSALLGWTRALAQADAVFLSDASGLLVGLAGELTHERAEAMGARLVLALEHADRMEADAQSSRFIAVDFGASVVSGMTVALPEGGRLVLGIVGKRPLEPGVRTDVERALADKVRPS